MRLLLGNWGILGIEALRIVVSCEAKDSGSLRPWKDSLLAEHWDLSSGQVRDCSCLGPRGLWIHRFLGGLGTWKVLSQGEM